MAETPAEQDLRYPLAAYNFRVTRGGSDMRFAKVSGLQREYRTLTYRHGLSFREGESIVRYALDHWISLTLEQGTVAKSDDLLAWLESGEVLPLAISLCGRDGQAAVTWKIAKAVPVKLSTAAFDARGNEVAIDTLEVKAAGVSIEYVK